MLEPKKGAIALCSTGRKGLITADAADKEGVWHGLHIGPENIGKPWQSKNPKVVQQTTPRSFQALMMMLKRAQALRVPRKPKATNA